jgi:hypothetical protein
MRIRMSIYLGTCHIRKAVLVTILGFLRMTNKQYNQCFEV